MRIVTREQVGTKNYSKGYLLGYILAQHQFNFVLYTLNNFGIPGKQGAVMETTKDWEADQILRSGTNPLRNSTSSSLQGLHRQPLVF